MLFEYYDAKQYRSKVVPNIKSDSEARKLLLKLAREIISYIEYSYNLVAHEIRIQMDCMKMHIDIQNDA